ncbi:hypothetical protein CTI12_AA013040 [Artemisia annua]|uniref:Ulp1 protease family, C-terminal catalytic domain-containing protein n=1 Tax=Artemisia annua TaxID=35608 RepID=A0A2U1QM55_ARTAN|nr:hypothetical protein CTI12_AA013040 [Artemisia annua]
MDLRAEISQSRDHSLAESDQNKLLNVDSGKILNPTPLSRFNPYDNKAKKQGNVPLARFNPYDKKAKKTSIVDVGKAAKPADVDVGKLASVVEVNAPVVQENEIVSVVQGKASVVQEMEKYYSAVVSDLANKNAPSVDVGKVNENEKETEKNLSSVGKRSAIIKDKAKDKGPDVLIEKEKASDITKDKDKKLKLKLKVKEPVKTTTKSLEKESVKALSEAPILRLEKPVQEETQLKRKLGLSKVDKSTKKPKLKVQKDADEKKKISKSNVVLKRKRGDSSGSDKEVDITPEDKGKKKMKGKRPLEIKKDDSPDDVIKQLLKNMLKNPSVKEYVKEEYEDNELMSKNKGKKKEKELTPDEIRHQEYLLKLPILQARTAPTALYTAIHGIKNVKVEKFLAEIRFSSFNKFAITKIPARLGRYVVEYFDEKTCRLKLENEKSIEATVSKVHDLLGIPIGGVSLLSLETRPVEDKFEEVWKSLFEPEKFKQVRVNDIALKLTESKEVDFLFKINFLTLFTNTMGMCSSLLGEINLDVVRRVREYTAISGIDWCEYIFHCLKIRQDIELKEEYFGMSELYDESKLPETEGFVAGGSSDTRTAPTALHTAIHGIKNVNVEKFLAEIVFSSFNKFAITKIPARLGRYVVENFDEKTCRLKLENEKSIEATVSKVHDLLGIPIGGVSLLSFETRPVEDVFEEVWKSQFEPNKFKKVRVNDIALKLTKTKEVDFFFKINFLTLFTNTMGMCSSLLGEINLDVVRRVRKYIDISGIDWCEYMFHCLKNSKAPTTVQNKYTDPYTLLALLYLDSTNFKELPVVRTRPTIKQWSSFLMAQRQDMELKEEYFGMSELYDESELPETEGFSAGGSSDNSYKEELLNNLEEKLAVLSNERTGFEELLAIAGLEFPVVDPSQIKEGSDDGNGDDKKDKDAEKRGDAVPENQVYEPFSLTQWIENHLDLIEEWFNCAAAEFYYSVAEGTMEPMGDGNQKTKVELKMTRPEFILGNSVFAMQGEKLERVFETHSGELYSVRLNMETLAPGLEVDANVIDCLAAILNHENSSRAAENVVCPSSKLYGHNKHVIIRKVKPRIASLKWKTKNNFIDCGVFTMLHMDNYTGEAPGKWDCGLVAESKEQSDQLRVLRFKLATKILLREDVELALEFDKLPSGEKLSIILSAVRNRDARDRKF